VDPSLQIDVRPVFSRRLKDERDNRQQDVMRRRYIEDKWRYMYLIFFLLFYIINLMQFILFADVIR